MTICIAGCMPALSDDEGAIAIVTDKMMSFNDDMPAAEGVTPKDWRLAVNWGCLLAGNPSVFDPLMDKIAERTKRLDDRSLDAYKIGLAVAGAYQELRTELIVLTHLKAYGFDTIHDFISRGLNSFGPERLAEFNKKIDGFDLGIEVLLYGFEARCIPHLVEIANPGVPHIRDPMPHWAIGSGTFMAMGVLNARGTEETNPSKNSCIASAKQNSFLSRLGHKLIKGIPTGIEM